MSESDLNELLTKVRDMHGLLHGDEDRPGLSNRLRQVESHFYGSDGTWGMKHKVEMMWRGHVWALCSMSGFAGWIAYWLFEKFLKG
jgi:hypothetical protein